MSVVVSWLNTSSRKLMPLEKLRLCHSCWLTWTFTLLKAASLVLWTWVRMQRQRLKLQSTLQQHTAAPSHGTAKLEPDRPSTRWGTQFFEDTAFDLKPCRRKRKPSCSGQFWPTSGGWQHKGPTWSNKGRDVLVFFSDSICCLGPFPVARLAFGTWTRGRMRCKYIGVRSKFRGNPGAEVAEFARRMAEWHCSRLTNQRRWSWWNWWHPLSYWQNSRKLITYTLILQTDAFDTSWISDKLIIHICIYAICNAWVYEGMLQSHHFFKFGKPFPIRQGKGQGQGQSQSQGNGEGSGDLQLFEMADGRIWEAKGQAKAKAKAANPPKAESRWAGRPFCVFFLHFF